MGASHVLRLGFRDNTSDTNDGGIVNAGIFFENNTLIIERAKKEDEGLYLCKATNELGEVSTAAFITVEGKLEIPGYIGNQ